MICRRLSGLTNVAWLLLMCSSAWADPRVPAHPGVLKPDELRYQHRLPRHVKSPSQAAPGPAHLAAASTGASSPMLDPSELAILHRQQRGVMFGASDPAVLPTLNTRHTMQLLFWRGSF